jgi:gliding motility-associated-like protein
MLTKKFITVALLILPQLVSAQMPLKTLEILYNQWVFPGAYLPSKVKLNGNHKKSTLFNSTSAIPQNISIHGLKPENYGYTGSIIIIEDTVGGLNGGLTAFIPTYGSSGQYGKDYDFDEKNNFVILGDNKGSRWNPEKFETIDQKDSTQLLLFKVDHGGKVIWYKLYGGSNAEYATSIRKTSDGNFIVLAQTQSKDGDVKSHIGGKDIWLFKINSDNGNIIWQKTFGSLLDETPTDLELLPDNSIIISGTAQQSPFAVSTYTGSNSFLMKMDQAGNFGWMRVFGGDGNDTIQSFTPVPGGYASIGTSTSSNGDYPENAGKSDVYIIKHDLEGKIVWRKRYGNKDSEEVGDIIITNCDNRIFATYAKEFNKDVYFSSTPAYPLYSQNAGVMVSLDLNGQELFYREDKFDYNTGPNGSLFSEYIIPTMIANDKGGFAGAHLLHAREGVRDGSSPSFYSISMTFSTVEYGFEQRKIKYDTTICSGEFAWGRRFSKDTAFIIRYTNDCGVDTLISSYSIKVISTNDSIIMKDTTICYGSNYNGRLMYNSFSQNDTLFITTVCGPKRIIKRLNVIITPNIDVALGKDTTVCRDGILLDMTYNGAIYKWNNNATSSKIFVKNSGQYSVQLKDSYGCILEDTINVKVEDHYLSRLRDTTILSGNAIQLVANTNGITSWKQSPFLSCLACNSTIANPDHNTTFYLKSTKANCVIEDSLRVIVLSNAFIYIPTAFTPNGDNINDIFRLTGNRISKIEMTLFNRWGQMIFRSNNQSQGWDGKVNGIMQESSTFIYNVSYQDADGKKHFLKGNFVLLR